MKKMTNFTRIIGSLYQHDLSMKESGPNSKTPGTQYISGNIEIATDDAGINIVPVHFTYVTATTSTGKPNSTFNVLKNIIDGVYKSVMEHGADKAQKFRIDSAIGLNEFYDRNDQFVSVKRNESGFVHAISSIDEAENKRNTFDVDIVITGVTHVEANEERNTPEKAVVKGAIFNFRNELMPVELSVLHPGAIDYFESLGANTKNPVFTQVRGNQISETIVREIVEESAFGDPSVREVKNTRKDFVITWAKTEPYEWDDESSITAKEFLDAIAARETTLATLKQRNDEYKASKGTTPAAAPAAGGFNF